MCYGSLPHEWPRAAAEVRLKQYLDIKYSVSSTYDGPGKRTFEKTYWFQEHDKIYWQDKALCHYPQHVKPNQNRRALK